MKSVAATNAKNRLGAILNEAQQEPIVIRRQDRDIAVVLSMATYERLRSGNVQHFSTCGRNWQRSHRSGTDGRTPRLSADRR